MTVWQLRKVLLQHQKVAQRRYTKVRSPIPTSLQNAYDTQRASRFNRDLLAPKDIIVQIW